jgi:sugar-specific transcriptional regulator TrmB
MDSVKEQGMVVPILKGEKKMFKAVNSKQLINNKHIILGSREKQHLLFLLVDLNLCYVLRRTCGVS